MKNRIMNRKTSNRLSPGGGKRRKCLRFFYGIFAAVTMIVCTAVPVLADGDPISVVNNLSTFIFGLIRAVGIILLGWGVVQVGMSFQSHDPSQRSQGFLTLAGGLVITFAKEILGLMGVS